MNPPRTEAYERLVLDGGWLTAAQLAMECGQSDGTVDRSLHRQAQRGWVEKRVIYLEGAGAYRNRRVEFKALIYQ